MDCIPQGVLDKPGSFDMPVADFILCILQSRKDLLTSRQMESEAYNAHVHQE